MGDWCFSNKGHRTINACPSVMLRQEEDLKGTRPANQSVSHLKAILAVWI